jgi:hypothetical protein
MIRLGSLAFLTGCYVVMMYGLGNNIQIETFPLSVQIKDGSIWY